MKLMYAGIAPNVNAETWRYNCNINRSCQKRFYIPIDDISTLDLYCDLPVMPSTFHIVMVDFCNDIEYSLTPSLYVVGQNQKSFYGVFSGLVSGARPQYFYIRAEFVEGVNTHVFFSNDFTTTDCFGLTRVEACYNNPTVGTDAFDINDIYYGYPLNQNVLGNPKWRYFHSVYVRFGKIANTQHKLSITMFNSKKAYKTSSSKIYNFSSEVVPAFYKDIIFGVVARGNILINNHPWQVSNEVSLSVHSEESELWVMDIPLVENKGTYFSCKDTICRGLLPDAPSDCCDVVVTGATAEIVVNPNQNCRSYEISGNDENSYYDYTDCVTRQWAEINLGRGTTTICSLTPPQGSGITIKDLGTCTN